jgi:hypothetical protein
MDVEGCADEEGSIVGDDDDATVFCKTKPVLDCSTSSCLAFSCPGVVALSYIGDSTADVCACLAAWFTRCDVVIRFFFDGILTFLFSLGCMICPKKHAKKNLVDTHSRAEA